MSCVSRTQNKKLSIKDKLILQSLIFSIFPISSTNCIICDDVRITEDRLQKSCLAKQETISLLTCGISKDIFFVFCYYGDEAVRNRLWIELEKAMAVVDNDTRIQKLAVLKEKMVMIETIITNMFCIQNEDVQSILWDDLREVMDATDNDNAKIKRLEVLKDDAHKKAVASLQEDIGGDRYKEVKNRLLFDLITVMDAKNDYDIKIKKLKELQKNVAISTDILHINAAVGNGLWCELKAVMGDTNDDTRIQKLEALQEKVGVISPISIDIYYIDDEIVRDRLTGELQKAVMNDVDDSVAKIAKLKTLKERVSIISSISTDISRSMYVSRGMDISNAEDWEFENRLWADLRDVVVAGGDVETLMALQEKAMIVGSISMGISSIENGELENILWTDLRTTVVAGSNVEVLKVLDKKVRVISAIGMDISSIESTIWQNRLWAGLRDVVVAGGNVVALNALQKKAEALADHTWIGDLTLVQQDRVTPETPEPTKKY